MTLTEKFCSAWRAGISMDDLLDQFVAETNSRAAGCWRLNVEHLELMGFGWASDMPDDVSHGFQTATKKVSLEQTGLGIVKAAVSQRPAVARRDAQATGLDGSASWIAKFGAKTSLAVPIRDHQTQSVIGVFAVSTATLIEEGDALWLKLIQLANDLAKANNQIA